jgi:hypothetical protein
VDGLFRWWHGYFVRYLMKNKQKAPDTGAQYAGTPPVQHAEVILARPDRAKSPEPEEEKSVKMINEDDIEADRHNGSGGAFEATEHQQDEE